MGEVETLQGVHVVEEVDIDGIDDDGVFGEVGAAFRGGRPWGFEAAHETGGIDGVTGVTLVFDSDDVAVGVDISVVLGAETGEEVAEVHLTVGHGDSPVGIDGALDMYGVLEELPVVVPDARRHHAEHSQQRCKNNSFFHIHFLFCLLSLNDLPYTNRYGIICKYNKNSDTEQILTDCLRSVAHDVQVVALVQQQHGDVLRVCYRTQLGARGEEVAQVAVASVGYKHDEDCRR